MTYSMLDKRSGTELDYAFDFFALGNDSGSDVEKSNWLEDDEYITDFNISVRAVTSGCLPLISGSYLNSASTIVTFWTTGGDVGKEYYFDCYFQSSASPISRKDKKTIKLKIVDK